MFAMHYTTHKFLLLHYNGFYTISPKRGEPTHDVQKRPSIKSRKAMPSSFRRVFF